MHGPGASCCHRGECKRMVSVNFQMHAVSLLHGTAQTALAQCSGTTAATLLICTAGKLHIRCSCPNLSPGGLQSLNVIQLVIATSDHLHYHLQAYAMRDTADRVTSRSRHPLLSCSAVSSQQGAVKPRHTGHQRLCHRESAHGNV